VDGGAGINFTDVGAASGLQDPTTTAFNGIRWLGSGSIIPLSNGHYGLFFGAGNCLDNDSDGFHFIAMPRRWPKSTARRTC
jgi:hypothetical protein